MKQTSPVDRPFLSTVFISPSEPRLRAGWRLVLQVVLQVTFTAIAALVFFLPYEIISRNTDISGFPFLLISEGIELLAILFSIFLARRFLDKRSFTSLGLSINRRMISDILAGFGIAFVIMGLIFFFEFFQGWLSINSFAWDLEPVQNVLTQVSLFFVVFILVAWNEELMSRGYHLQTITSGLNIIWGLIISSLIFGGLHLANPNATWVSALGIFFAGLFLGYAYIRTGRLWLSIGIHIGWNFFEGVVFGFPVSGLDIYRLINTRVTGPILWTGGPFGPEAGLIILPFLALGVGLVYLYSRRTYLYESQD